MSGCKLTPELSRKYEVCRVWMLVMEEWLVYFETDDQDTNKEIAAKLSDIKAPLIVSVVSGALTQIRAAAVAAAWLATQDSSHSNQQDVMPKRKPPPPRGSPPRTSTSPGPCSR